MPENSLCKNCNNEFQKWSKLQLYCIECRYKIEKKRNKEKFKNWYKNLTIEKKNRILEKTKNWAKSDQFRNYIKTYRTTDKYRAKLKLYRYRRRKKIDNRIIENFRATLNHALFKQKIQKTNKTLDLLGCSISYFKKYLEEKFIKEMNWDNYGKIWHLDHIIPTSVIDLTKLDNRKFVFNYKNIQPMLAKQNIKKSNHIEFKIKKHSTLGECQSLISSLVNKFKPDLKYEVNLYGGPNYSIFIRIPKNQLN